MAALTMAAYLYMTHFTKHLLSIEHDQEPKVHISHITVRNSELKQ